MDYSVLKEQIVALVNNSELNYIRAEDAIAPEYAGVRFFDEPLIAVADAADPYFTGLFKEPQVIGPHFREPELWLEGAKSVISFFLPFTETVRDSNRPAVDVPYDESISNQRCSALWLHGRIEGQHFINVLSADICALLQEQGFRAVAPSISPEFKTVNNFSSNWSERHVAYAAGLGTFGLSKGLITEKGMAGRFGSVITSAAFPVTERKYSDPFAYCTMCGACQRRCPAGAIDVTKGCALGKDQLICGPYVKGSSLPPQGPNGVVRYGCGKCQVGVPCEHSIPGAPRKYSRNYSCDDDNIDALRELYKDGLHFVVGDLHGEYETLKGLLAKIKYDPEKDHVYFVGDYGDHNDRGNPKWLTPVSAWRSLTQLRKRMKES